MKHYGDITKISGYEVEPVDIVTGGSPCQDLSVAGKRAGLAGERSGLFMEQIRVIKEMRENDRRNGRSDDDIRPRYMVWENVPGALSSGDPKGEDFRIVLEETARVVDPTAVIPRLAEGQKWTNAGCIMGDGWSIAWRIHDAQFWGVPQRRRRIALVADFRGESAPEILFEREGLSRDSEPGEQTGERTSEGIKGSIGESSEGIEKQTAFGFSAYDSNAMKSPNPHSGCYKADTSRTLDNNGGNPTCNQGGGAILEGNGARNSHRGDGYRIGETSYTLNTVEVHAVAVDVRNGVENERTNGTLQAKPNGGTSLNLNNIVRETTGVDVYNGETTGETAVTLTAHAGGGNTAGPKVLT